MVCWIVQRRPPHRLQTAEQQQHVGPQDFGQLGGDFFFCQLPLERVVIQQLQFGRAALIAEGKRLGPGEVKPELVGKRSGQGVRTAIEPVQTSLPGCMTADVICGAMARKTLP